MKRTLAALLVLYPAFLTAHATEQLIPAGSLIQCTVAEPKISSKTEKIGDPVLCQVSHVELYGRSTFPYGSYLVGHFEDYKDPGHFFGKGWMELKFDRLVVHDEVIPVDARVVSVPKYPVDQEGRIHGTGHAVRDTVEWFIPVLWPIDLINLPRRGPRPVLKPETRMTLKVMDDFGIPDRQEAARQPVLQAREQQPAPIQQAYAPAPVQQSYAPAPIQQAYAPQPQTIVYQNFAPQPQPQTVVQQVPVQVPVPYPVTYGYAAPPPYGYAYSPYAPRVIYRSGYYAPY